MAVFVLLYEDEIRSVEGPDARRVGQGSYSDPEASDE